MEPGKSKSTTFTNAQLEKNCFLRRLYDCNTIASFQSWIFRDGMYFSDNHQWWNSTTNRPRPHEGLDIVFYLSNTGKQYPFRAGTVVPAIFDGIANHSHSDFLGKTLYVRHEQFQQNSKVLHSLYAHIALIDNLPETVSTHSTIATIAEVPDTSPVPAHLHLSVAWIEKRLKIDTINWDTIVNDDSIDLVDPMPFIIRDPETIQSLVYDE